MKDINFEVLGTLSLIESQDIPDQFCILQNGQVIFCGSERQCKVLTGAVALRGDLQEAIKEAQFSDIHSYVF